MGSGEVSLPGAVEQMQPLFISRFLEGQSGVTIKSVSCGDLFTTCMTGWLAVEISISMIMSSKRIVFYFCFYTIFFVIFRQGHHYDIWQWQ